MSDTAYLVSPGVFQRYAQEHLQVAALAKQEGQQDWQWVQKRFDRLQLHRKQPNGLNIWTCEVTGPRKTRRLHGYLLNEPSLLFPELPLSPLSLPLPFLSPAPPLPSFPLCCLLSSWGFSPFFFPLFGCFLPFSSCCHPSSGRSMSFAARYRPCTAAVGWAA
ncbi:hypothetical protein RLIN73S_03932 [Rhodanobacter lindaniclasticus]